MATDLTSVTRFIPGEVIEYLGHHHVITLSTSSFTGIPHADTVVYVNDARSICFFAGEGTKMLRNIMDSRYVSFTIDDYTVDWRKVRELQGVGRCRPVTPEQDAAAWSMYLSKFGPKFTRPPGVMHAVIPSEMHFVDYDYATVTGQSPQVRSRLFQIEDTPPPPSQGAVATDLDRLTYEPGEIIFRPGQSKGEYYVVIEGQVEIRAEGHGADQTVLRLGPGQFFGDQATLRGQQGALTCRAVTRAVLLGVDRTALRDLFDAGPHLSTSPCFLTARPGGCGAANRPPRSQVHRRLDGQPPGGPGFGRVGVFPSMGSGHTHLRQRAARAPSMINV